MVEFELAGKRISAIPADGGCMVYLHGDAVQAGMLSRQFGNVSFASVEGIDWNRELSPWPAKAVFRGRPDFGGGAGDYLRELTGRIVPQVEERIGIAPTHRILAGYSMAGLFAVYAGVQSACFDAVASVSGSFWYPDFVKYIEQNAFWPRHAYFSVGEREKLGRNAAFHSIETDTQRICDCLRRRGVRTVFELNSGGHFDDAANRLNRAVGWILKGLEQ